MKGIKWFICNGGKKTSQISSQKLILFKKCIKSLGEEFIQGSFTKIVCPEFVFIRIFEFRLPSIMLIYIEELNVIGREDCTQISPVTICDELTVFYRD